MAIIKPNITFDHRQLGGGAFSCDAAPSAPAAPKAPQQIKGSRSSAPPALRFDVDFWGF